MNRTHIYWPAPRALAHFRRLSALTLLAMVLALLAPFGFPPINAHAQPSTGGIVAAWGLNESGQASVPSGLRDVVAIAAGDYHNLALKRDGTVVAWGGNYGQASVLAGLSDVTAIAAGTYHNLALKRDGTVVAWGGNGFGQASVPAGLSDVVAIAAGAFHNLALKRDGTVVAWGGNVGQASVPADLRDVTAIAAGTYHNLALKRDGTVVAWGWNDFGQTDVPAGLRDVTAIATGSWHSLALKRDGTVVAWGWNDYGQASVPAGLTNVVAIATGFTHSLALKRDGRVVAWGGNEYGQTNVPAGLTNVTAIAAGFAHSLAVTPPLVPDYSASVEVISAPTSVVENTLESDQFIRLFAERQNYTLPADLTIDALGAPGMVIPAGTRVNVYYIHADKVGNNNSTRLKLAGSVTFGTQVLAVITYGGALMNSHSALGAPGTAYSSSVDQGLELWADDKATLSGQNQLNLTLNLWGQSDDVRVITLAE
jgi:hypothetical protein